MLDSSAASAQSIQPFPSFAFAGPFIFSTEAIAAILSFVVAYHFYRFYRLSGILYLLGIVIGFSFITFSNLVLATDVWLEFDPGLFNFVYWMGILSLSYGFSFLAVSYYCKHREEDKVPLLMRISALSAIPLMLVIAVVAILPLTLDLPPYHNMDEYFSAFNMVALGYVFKSTIGSIVDQGKRGFKYIPAAYAVLWLGQYSAFIYNIDGTTSVFTVQMVANLVGLTLFVGVLSKVIRRKRVEEKGAQA